MTDVVSPATAPDLDADLDFEFPPGGLDPKTLLIRDNVRLNDHVEEDKELLDTVRERGVRTAINAYRDADGSVVVLRGHRRTLAAIMTGRTRVPVLIEPKPTPAERIADQLIENDQRRGLATAEHVGAYQQLEALGWDEARISATSGTPIDRVRAGLAVAKSPVAAKAIASSDKVDLFVGHAFVEFADDPDAIADLEMAVAEGNVNHILRDLRHKRRLAAVRAEAEDALEQEYPGVPVLRGLERLNLFTPHGKKWRLESMRAKQGVEKEMTRAQHAKCPGHAAAIEVDHKGYDSSMQQILVPKTVWLCTDAPKHGHIPRYAEDGSSIKVKLADMDPEQAVVARAEAAMTRANNAAMRVATTDRLLFIKELLNRKTAPSGTGAFLAVSLFRWSAKLRFTGERSFKTAHAMFGIDRPQYGTAEAFDALGDQVSDARGLLMCLVNVMSAWEENMDDSAWRVTGSGQQTYFQFLASAGYQLSPVEEMAAGLCGIYNIELGENR